MAVKLVNCFYFVNRKHILEYSGDYLQGAFLKKAPFLSLPVSFLSCVLNTGALNMISIHTNEQLVKLAP